MSIHSPADLVAPSTLVTPDGYDSTSTFTWTASDDTPEELVQSLEFTVWLCKPTGEPIELLDQLQSRQIVQQLNLPNSFSLTLSVDDAVYPFIVFESVPRLKVFRNATAAELAIDPTTLKILEFYGTLPSSGIDEDSETGDAKLTFQEPSWVFNDRHLPAAVTFTQIDQGAILWSLINDQNNRVNGDTFIRQGAVTTGTLRDRTYEAGKELAALIQEMTQVDGGCDVGLIPVDYWEIDGTNGMATFNAYAEKGVDRPTVEFISGRDTTLGAAASRIGANCHFRRTRTKTVTSATSVGTDDSQTYANTTSPYGLLEEYETFNDVSISQTLLDKSVGKVGNAQNAPMVLEVRPTDSAPQPLIDYRLGDTVYSTCRRGGMAFEDLATRVHGIDITIDQNGRLTTKPTVATLPETIVSPTLPGGGVPGGGTVTGERLTGIAYSSSGTIDTDTVVQYLGENSTRWFPSLTLSLDKAYGYANGLRLGTSYIVRCKVRGPDSAPLFACTTFEAYVGTQVSANDAAHVNSAVLAIRQTWVELVVSFTATAETMEAGVYFQGNDAAQNLYIAHWTIELA